MATSSAIRLADLALAWSSSSFDADLEIIDLDLASDRGIKTAALLSLLLDRRAEDDDVPPSGDPNDRRGWWADEFADVPGDRIGSRLWLLARAKRTPETRRKAEDYTREALAWMIEDRVASKVDITVETTANAIFIGVEVHRPGRDSVSVKFAHAWEQEL